MVKNPLILKEIDKILVCLTYGGTMKDIKLVSLKFSAHMAIAGGSIQHPYNVFVAVF